VVDDSAVSLGVTKYYYHGDLRVAMRQDNVVYFIHSDHLGSTSLTTDITGTLVAETRYLPYGEERWISGTLVTDFTFTGQRAEAGFRLMDYNARYYDPWLGRFVSADTVVPNPGNPQAWNRYSYALNDPLRYVDPTGHQDEPTWWEKLKRTISQLLDIARRRNPDTGYDTCGVFGCQTLQGPPQQVLLIGPQEAEQLRQLAQITDQAEQLAKFTSVYHATTSEDAAQSITTNIDRERLSADSRFGRAFYVAQDAGTALAEVQAGGREATHMVAFDLDMDNAKILDLTDPTTAEAWGYVHDAEAKELHQSIGQRAREAGYDVIKFESFQAPGSINYAVLQRFDELLIPLTAAPTR
jgi:RHS repeat-associated protein